jgi:hypothetical protein
MASESALEALNAVGGLLSRECSAFFALLADAFKVHGVRRLHPLAEMRPGLIESTGYFPHALQNNRQD